MRRVVLAVAALTASLALPGVAYAQTTGHDSVAGTAQDCPAPETCPPGSPPFVSLSAGAVSGPGGEDPGGTMAWSESVGGDLRLWVNVARVTCLSVSGHTAIIGVEGTSTSERFDWMVSLAGLIRVTDRGGPGSGLDTFELHIQKNPVSVTPLPPLPGPTDCSSFPSGVQPLPNVEGDLVVTDVGSLPTSAGECRNAGWRNFPGFRSRGQCLVFVLQTRLCTFLERFGHRPRFCPARPPTR